MSLVKHSAGVSAMHEAGTGFLGGSSGRGFIYGVGDRASRLTNTGYTNLTIGRAYDCFDRLLNHI